MTPELAEDVRVLNRVRSQKRARIFLKRARYGRVNARRGELIRLKIRGLLAEDDPEYVALDRCVFRLVELAYPLPEPDPRVQALLDRYAPRVDEHGVLRDPLDDPT